MAMKKRLMLVFTAINDRMSLSGTDAWTHHKLDDAIRTMAWIHKLSAEAGGKFPDSLSTPPDSFQPEYYPFEAGGPVPGDTHLGNFPAPGIVIAVHDCSLDIDIIRLRLTTEDRVQEFLESDQFKPDTSTHDVFISYASTGSSRAREIEGALKKKGVRTFLAEKSVKGGDEWAESIRVALVGSSEMCILCSPAALESEWILTEWGAAWALGKRIVPILHRVDVSQLPTRLQASQCRDLSDIQRYAKEVHERVK